MQPLTPSLRTPIFQLQLHLNNTDAPNLKKSKPGYSELCSVVLFFLSFFFCFESTFWRRMGAGAGGWGLEGLLDLFCYRKEKCKEITDTLLQSMKKKSNMHKVLLRYRNLCWPLHRQWHDQGKKQIIICVVFFKCVAMATMANWSTGVSRWMTGLYMHSLHAVLVCMSACVLAGANVFWDQFAKAQ